MRKRWLLTLIAAVPAAAAILTLESCGGVGGPTGPGGGGGGGTSSTFLALLSPAQQAATYVGVAKCAECHSTDSAKVHGGAKLASYKGSVANPKLSIIDQWKQTMHYQKGVTCENCHGPGSLHVADPTNKDKVLTYAHDFADATQAPSNPEGITSPTVCAQCHGPTVDQWKFAKHSLLLTTPVDEAITNPATYGRASRCIACHSGLFRTQIYEEGDINAISDADISKIASNTLHKVPYVATCTTCHDAHSVTGNLTASGQEAQLYHPVANFDPTNVGPGQTPDTFTHFNQICAQCHNGRGTDPGDAKLNTSTARPGMHYSNQYNMLMGVGAVDNGNKGEVTHGSTAGQCSQCHMAGGNHSFVVSYEGCAPCHSIPVAAAKVDTVQAQTLNRLLQLRADLSSWSQAILHDPDLWDYTSFITALGKTPPNQSLIPIGVKRARYNYYFIVNCGDYGVHNYKYVDNLLTIAENNIPGHAQAQGKDYNGLTTAQKKAIIEADRAKSKNDPGVE
ncbi:MAG: hypothetical protein JSS72_06555 [Armatimonadetes bacterium]|nr:hypothetical protein [Armatimonadota bacterium]